MKHSKVLDTDYYVISDDFRILEFNRNVSTRYNGIKCGDLCYKATMRRDSPCPHCPIAGNSSDSKSIYYDPFYRDWVQAVFSEIGEGKYAVTCRVADDNALTLFQKLRLDDISLGSSFLKGYDLENIGMIGGYCEEGFPLYYVNEQMVRMLGYDSRQDFEKGIAGKVVNTIHPDDLARVNLDIGGSYHVGMKYETTYRMPRKDGSWFWTVDRGEVIETAEGKLAIISICLDVSKEHELEAVRESERRAVDSRDQLLTAITRRLYGYTITVNVNTGKFTLISGTGMEGPVAYLKTLNNYDEAFKTFCRSLDGACIERAVKMLSLDTYRGKIEKSGFVGTDVFLSTTPAGQKAWQEMNVIAWFDRNGEPMLSILGRDVTESHEKADTEAQLEIAKAASAAKSAFLFSMSHDIRTPMNAILGFANLMEKELGNPEKLLDYLKKIKISGDTLMHIINNVLELSHLESGKESLNESVMDLMDDSLELDPLFENDISRKKLSLTYDMDIVHRYIYVDISKIRNITMNLISNAIKYTPNGGKIHMHLHEYPGVRSGYGVYVITVTDNGIGMSEEFQRKIFETFTREHTTTQCKASGMGLGMAIVKKYVDLMGGKIDIESQIGKGTCFKVTLEHRLAKGKMSEGTEKNVIDLKGKRILLAEDNELNAEIAVAILEETGAKIDIAADGLICVKMMQDSPAGYYDLILMDIQMPNLNGYEATEKIRSLADSRKAKIPIIAMTANAFEEDRQDALASGMNAHLAKPVIIDELKATLQEILK